MRYILRWKTKKWEIKVPLSEHVMRLKYEVVKRYQDYEFLTPLHPRLQTYFLNSMSVSLSLCSPLSHYSNMGACRERVFPGHWRTHYDPLSF